MGRKYYDDLITKTETHIIFILTIQIQGEKDYRYVSKKEREDYNAEEIGSDISKFLESYRFPPNTNYNIQILTQIQNIHTVTIKQIVFKNPYVGKVMYNEKI